MSRLLADLCPEMRPRANAYLAALVERKVPVMIIDTLRTEREAAEYLAKGTSKTTRSYHLPQVACPACGALENTHGTRGLSHAIDVAPYSDYRRARGKIVEVKLNWKGGTPSWTAVGDAAEDVGFTWGGRWRSFKDYAHAQHEGPWCGSEAQSRRIRALARELKAA